MLGIDDIIEKFKVDISAFWEWLNENLQILRNSGDIQKWWFPKMGVPQNGWFKGKFLLKWMIWGYPYFRKPPYFGSHVHYVTKKCIYRSQHHAAANLFICTTSPKGIHIAMLVPGCCGEFRVYWLITCDTLLLQTCDNETGKQINGIVCGDINRYWQ